MVSEGSPSPDICWDRDALFAAHFPSFEDFHEAVSSEGLERSASQRILAKVPNTLSCVEHAALDEGELTGRFRRVRFFEPLLLLVGWSVSACRF